MHYANLNSFCCLHAATLFEKYEKENLFDCLLSHCDIQILSSTSNRRFREIITLGIYWLLSKLRGIINVSFRNILQPSLYFMTIWSILSSEFYIAIIEKFIVIYVKEMRACSSYWHNISNIYILYYEDVNKYLYTSSEFENALSSSTWHLMKEVKRNRRNEVTLYLSKNFAFAIGICIS